MEAEKEFVYHYKKGRSVIVLAYTHSAVANIKNNFGVPANFKDFSDILTKKEEPKILAEVRDKVQMHTLTLDAYFGYNTENEGLNDESIEPTDQQFESQHKTMRQYDVYLVDEYSMVSHTKCFQFLNRIRNKNPRAIIKFFGDDGQCPQTTKLKYRLRKCQVLKDILGTNAKTIILPYIKGSNQRCDKNQIKIIESLEKDCMVPWELFEQRMQS